MHIEEGEVYEPPEYAILPVSAPEAMPSYYVRTSSCLEKRSIPEEVVSKICTKNDIDMVRRGLQLSATSIQANELIP
jgi:hypothetical protein